MSTLLSAYDVAGRVLRLIGTYSINDDAPDAAEVEEVLYWLDIEMAAFAGKNHVFWLVPATLVIPLTASTKTYNIEETLAGDWPTLGVQFPLHATLNRSTDGQLLTELELITRRAYEEISSPDTSGIPRVAHIDRLATPTMRVYPVPGAEATNLSVRLVVQTFAPTFVGLDEIGVGVRAAWQKWLIHRVAASCAAGPIRRLHEHDIRRFNGIADLEEVKLLAFENREHQTTPPICEAYR